MIKKITITDMLIALIILSSIILSGCGTVPVVAGVVPVSQPESEPEPVLPPVLGPEAAREAALDFIQVSFGSAAPSPDAIWVGGEASVDGSVGSSIFQYVTTGWVARISFPLVAPDATIYTVVISQDAPGFSWEGIVDANGKVTTTILTFDDAPSPTPEVVEPEPIPTSEHTPEVIEPEPTPTPEPTPIVDLGPCNAVKFIADVTIPDGTTFAPNVDFTKVWRLKNVGRCTWSSSYDLIFIDGAQMDASKVISLPARVKSGESVDVAVVMTSPGEVGDYIGSWMLRSTDGEIFGLGEAANKAFWVSIHVDDPGNSTPPPEEILTWEGYIWSTNHAAQFDDYFERTDLGQTLLFGIESMDSELEALIVSLRDSGEKVRLEGMLYSNVIDYNGSQIVVTHIEVLE